jgi:Trypsin
MTAFRAFSTLYLFLLVAVPLHGLEPRIMKGEKARLIDNPWVCAIVVEETYKLIATGTILSARWVLTATHIWLSELSRKR